MSNERPPIDFDSPEGLDAYVKSVKKTLLVWKDEMFRDFSFIDYDNEPQYEHSYNELAIREVAGIFEDSELEIVCKGILKARHAGIEDKEIHRQMRKEWLEEVTMPGQVVTNAETLFALDSFYDHQSDAFMIDVA